MSITSLHHDLRVLEPSFIMNTIRALYTMAKISIDKIRANRNTGSLKARSFKIHPTVCSAFEKKARQLGCSKISLLERMMVEFLNKD